MILATRSGPKHVRSGLFNDQPVVSMGRHWLAPSGMVVNDDTASGLPAVGRAWRVIADLVGTLPLRVYEGRRGQRRERDDTDQGALLAAPVLGLSDYQWRYDIAMALEVCENAYLRKLKDKRGVVRQLEPIPHMYVSAYVSREGRKVFEIADVRGVRRLGEDEVLHIRGHTIEGGPFGVSRIHQHRDPLGAMLAAQRFEGAYFRNHARPDIALVFPEKITQTQANEWKDYWTSQYGGAGNAGQAIPLGAGADIKPIPMSMRDAQFIESKQWNVEEIARMLDVEPVMLGSARQEVDDKAAMSRFLVFQGRSRLSRIERGLLADPDLFAPGGAVYPAFEIDDLMYADPLTRAQVQHERIQSGMELVDEARADNGRGPLPPVPDDWTQEPGQVPQITPVGGAPNPTRDTEPSQVPVDEARGITMPSVEVRLEQDMEPLARELGLAFSHVSGLIEDLTGALAATAAREATVRETRERRTAERQLEEARVQAEALRETLAGMGVTVNVEAPAVTVENHMPEMHPPDVHVTVEQPSSDRDVKFKRDPSGRITGATVKEQ